MGILRTNTLSGLETPTPVTGSVQFTGTTSALAVPAGTDFAYGTGTFTIECFIYAPTLAATPGALYADHHIFSQTVDGTNYLMLSYEPNGTLYWTNATSGGGTVVTTSSGVVVANKWQHIVASRDSNNILRMFVDGSVVYSGYNNFDFNDTTRNPTIGNYTHIYSQLPFTGHISNFRILKGTALYTGNFTPPTRELQPIGDTVLLCCNNSTSATAEATGKTITANGNAVASTFSPGLVRDFTYGTQFSGVSRFDTQGYFVPPSGNTQNRYTLGLNEIVTSGLVLHLDAGNPFSYPATGVGTKWTDLSGNNNHGTLTNGVSYTENNRGALVFDGSDDYVNTPNSASLLAVGNGSFTLAAWFKLSGTKTWSQNLIRRDNYLVQGGENRRIIDLYAAANTNFANFSVYDGSGINATGSQNLNDGLWHYVVGVYESSTKTQYLYVDGVLKTQAVYNNTQSFNTSNESYAIGNVSSNYTGEPFFGNIGQASIYNRALTAAEVSQNYEALKGRYGLP